jgi:hypothetical protein
VAVTDMPVGAAARGADIVIGLGGGRRISSVPPGRAGAFCHRKGKLVQKKLLGDASCS